MWRQIVPQGLRQCIPGGSQQLRRHDSGERRSFTVELEAEVLSPGGEGESDVGGVVPELDGGRSPFGGGRDELEGNRSARDGGSSPPRGGGEVAKGARHSPPSGAHR